MPAHTWRGLKADWIVSVVSVMVLLVAIESAICIHHTILMARLMAMVLLGVCGLALRVAGLVESLRVPPVAFRLLQRLHGARGPLAVIERVAAASLVGLLVLLVVPIVVPVTLAETLI